MSASTDLIQLTDYTAIFPSTSANTTLLTSLITQASLIVSNYCRHQLASASYVEYYDLPNQDTADPRKNGISLLNYPITALTSVIYDPTLTFGGNGQTLAPVTFEPRGIIYLPYLVAPNINYNPTLGAYSNQRALQVSYTAGYSLGNVPADIVLATVITTNYFYQRATANTFGIKGSFNEAGGLTATFELSIPQAAKDILAPYRGGIVF